MAAVVDVLNSVGRNCILSAVAYFSKIKATQQRDKITRQMIAGRNRDIHKAPCEEKYVMQLLFDHHPQPTASETHPDTPKFCGLKHCTFTNVRTTETPHALNSRRD